eukprot:scaffold104102_cov57-Phaeocystis_antarctica.AAC.1
MSTWSTPSTAKSASICRRTASAAWAGVLPAGGLAIFVVRKSLPRRSLLFVSPAVASARATPSRSMPG